MLLRTVVLFSESKTAEIASVAISCRLTYSVLSMNLAPGTLDELVCLRASSTSNTKTVDWSGFLFFFLGGCLKLSLNLEENKRTVLLHMHVLTLFML